MNCFELDEHTTNLIDERKARNKTMAIDLVTNRHKRIQNMSIDDMAEYFSETLEMCHKPIIDMPCNKVLCKSCMQCWKEFLQGSDT